jgi:hypothetical protein
MRVLRAGPDFEEDLSIRRNVIEGNPLLDTAATDAIKQRMYRPLTLNGKLVNRTVVLLTSDKNGKVH